MRFYTKQHKFYCGIDLHARTMYLCILNEEGKIVLHRNIKTDPILSNIDKWLAQIFDLMPFLKPSRN